MARKKVDRTGADESDEALSPDVRHLLAEISREPVPDRLLALARELQAALNRKIPAES